MKTIAVIGTAGRDKTRTMNLELWQWMLAKGRELIPAGSHLVSGGAAWADHVAVALFIEGHAAALTLHLPAPFKDQFIGPRNSAASAANYYHDKFSRAIGEDTRKQITQVCSMDNVYGSFQPEALGYKAMFTRNKLVATQAKGVLAFTFGIGDVPADGGTLDTWNQCKGTKIHVTLPTL